MTTFACHIPDDYQYCRRCGEAVLGIVDRRNEPCTPPDDILVLVNRRLASIVSTNNIERDVQWAVKSITERAKHPPRAPFADGDDAA